MKRELRRVTLARRQAMLADISQRAAMRSLADALAEETRSQSIARRSRDLATHYGGYAKSGDAGTLAANARFAAALGSLANSAEQARADAAQQAAWQVEALGKAQTRARRHAERLDIATAEYRAARERRASDPSPQAGATPSLGLARNVQASEQNRWEAATPPTPIPPVNPQEGQAHDHQRASTHAHEWTGKRGSGAIGADGTGGT